MEAPSLFLFSDVLEFVRQNFRKIWLEFVNIEN